MGKIYHLGITDVCIDPKARLLSILHDIGETATLYTSKEALQEFTSHPLVRGILKDIHGEIVTWTDLEEYLEVDFKFQPEWDKHVFTPYRDSVSTGDLIVLGEH